MYWLLGYKMCWILFWRGKSIDLLPQLDAVKKTEFLYFPLHTAIWKTLILFFSALNNSITISMHLSTAFLPHCKWTQPGVFFLLVVLSGSKVVSWRCWFFFLGLNYFSHLIHGNALISVWLVGIWFEQIPFCYLLRRSCKLQCSHQDFALGSRRAPSAEK